MAAGDPTGADLCSGTTDGNTLSDAPTTEEREITINTPIELTSGIKYAIVIRVLSGDGSNAVHWWRKTSNNYADGVGVYSLNSGSTWSQQSTTDMWFATKASGIEKDTHKANDVSTAASYGVIWRGQTFTASSTYTISSIVLKLSKTGSPGTVTVSIRATATVPSKATTPAPADAASDVTLDQATLTWVDGGGADTFNVYYGTESGNLSLVSSAQAGASFTVTGVTDGSPYSYLSTRYWRIDSVNTNGSTSGDEWSFSTIRLSPPATTYFYSTGGYYYQLLVQEDGSYGDLPGVGVENVDYVIVAFLPNFISTRRKLVAIAENRFWYEEI